MEKTEKRFNFQSYKLNVEKIANSVEKIITSDEFIVLLVLFTVALSLLDFYSHPNQGLADPERRKILREIIGPMARHIGNYGFMAAGGIAAVLGKNILNFLSDKKTVENIAKYSFMGFVAAALACNALFEFVPNNKEGLNDFYFGVSGITMGISAAFLATRKFKRAKQKKKNKKSAIIHS